MAKIAIHLLYIFTSIFANERKKQGQPNRCPRSFLLRAIPGYFNVTHIAGRTARVDTFTAVPA